MSGPKVAPTPGASSGARASRGVLSPIIELRRAQTVAPLAKGGVVLWAAFGCAWVALALVGWGRWIFSSQIGAQHVAASGIPSVDKVFMISYQLLLIPALLTLIVIYVVRPLVRDRRLSMEAMLMIGCFFAWFVDPVANHSHTLAGTQFASDSYMVNVGSWGNFMPGYSGFAHYSEPLWAVGDYMIFGVVGPIVGCGLISALRRRLPRLEGWAVFAIVFAILFVLFSVFDWGRVRLGMYAYGQGWKPLTLWPGKAYQWPVYGGVFDAMLVMTITYVRWSWLTTGSSFVDAGIERLHLGNRSRQVVLLFAVIGLCAATCLLTWFVPWSWTGTMSHQSVAHLPAYLLPIPAVH